MSWTVDHIFRPTLTAPPLIQFKPPTNHCSDRDFSFSRALSSRIQLFFGTGKKSFSKLSESTFSRNRFRDVGVGVVGRPPTPKKAEERRKQDRMNWIQYCDWNFSLRDSNWWPPRWKRIQPLVLKRNEKEVHNNKNIIFGFLGTAESSTVRKQC